MGDETFHLRITGKVVGGYETIDGDLDREEAKKLLNALIVWFTKPSKVVDKGE